MTEQPTPNDAFFAAINESKKTWGEVRRLDDEDPKLDVAARSPIKLERKIARMPAMTAEGYHAKVEVIRKAEFDDEVLPGIMFLLGRDAERLGIADDPPDLRSDW
jgi:hypothetical protein